MVSSELGSCEWFVWDLRRSGLIDRGQLDQLVGEFLRKSPRAEPAGLAAHLVSQGSLSPFQADRILQGKTQGLVLGAYILTDSIGQGSMGQVYKATNKTDSQLYAVKVLPRRSMWNVRLARRQVRAFSQFNHAAVVPFVDVGTSGGQHYLVWPLVEGETLEAKVQREGKLTPDVAATIVSQVAQGLAAAHAQEIFHGLVKPSNILLGADGQAKILDFGIGSLLAENEGESLVDTMSTANTLTSGLDCSSPESIMEPTNRTRAGDQYSLGCVLYYCLSGRYPFGEGTAVEKMMAHQFNQPTPIREAAPGIPDGLSTVIERLMQKAPDNRYTGVDELVDALQPYAVQPNRAGSRFGQSASASRVPPSNHGSRVPPSAAPATSSPVVPTPPGGPLTPVPAAPTGGSLFGSGWSSHANGPSSHDSGGSGAGSRFGTAMPGAKLAPPKLPTARPASVTRGVLKQPGGSSHGHLPTAVEAAIPVALLSDSREAAPFAEPMGGRITSLDEPAQRGMSLLFKVLVVVTVMISVFIIGKSLLFQS
jgi:serine/threonine-protein kinase